MSHQIIDTCQVKASKASYRMLRKERGRKEGKERKRKEGDVMRQVKTDYSTVYMYDKGT